MKKFLVILGYSKTGTTSIQRALLEHSSIHLLERRRRQFLENKPFLERWKLKILGPDVQDMYLPGQHLDHYITLTDRTDFDPDLCREKILEQTTPGWNALEYFAIRPGFGTRLAECLHSVLPERR